VVYVDRIIDARKGLVVRLFTLVLIVLIVLLVSVIIIMHSTGFLEMMAKTINSLNPIP
jgi:hypothetical protein